jgi:hypothetical protein
MRTRLSEGVFAKPEQSLMQSGDAVADFIFRHVKRGKNSHDIVARSNGEEMFVRGGGDKVAGGNPIVKLQAAQQASDTHLGYKIRKLVLDFRQTLPQEA